MKLAQTTIEEKKEVLRNWKKFEAYHLVRKKKTTNFCFLYVYHNQ
jgi:hypothetical protein